MRDQEIIQMTIKIPKELKEAFAECCKAKDTTVSRELREHIRRYVAKNGQQCLL